MDFTYLKIVVYVPATHGQLIRDVLAKNACGKIGNYDSCSFTVRGSGRFRPLEGSKPFIGQQDRVEEVAEERIETVVEAEQAENVVAALREAHPYEEAVIDLYPLLNK